MKYKNLTFETTAKGYKVTADNGLYKEVFTNLDEATSWLYNMADNNDIGNEFVQRIYKKMGK